MAKVSSDWRSDLRRLERALAADVAGHEHEWARRVHDGLKSLLLAMRRHAAESHGEDGGMTDVEMTRPTVARQVAELARDHQALLERTVALCRQVQSARAAFGVDRPGAGQTPTAIPDFGVLRKRAHELLAGLRRHQERETDIIQESVTTDIGVGD